MENLCIEEDTRARATSDRHFVVEIDFTFLDFSPLSFLRLLIGDLMAAPDELRRSILGHHVIQAENNYRCVHVGKLLERRIPMEIPVADAVADTRRLGARDEVIEAKFGTSE